MRRKFGGGSERGIPSEIGLSSGVNRINAVGRITSEANNTLVGDSDFSQYQRPILDWQENIQELYDALTENIKGDTPRN